MKWYSLSEYVDVETGELFDKATFLREFYVKINKVTKTEYKDGYNIRKVTYECERNRQQRIKFDD